MTGDVAVPATVYRGKRWDELRVGDTFWSSSRTVTENDIAAFAAVSGDFNPLHMDAELGRASPFGERVPHGPLGLLFAMGGADRIGLLEGVALAMLEITWRFVAPMKVGDTLRTRIVVSELKEVSKADRGIVKLAFFLHNQRDAVVQQGEHTYLIRRGR